MSSDRRIPWLRVFAEGTLRGYGLHGSGDVAAHPEGRGCSARSIRVYCSAAIAVQYLLGVDDVAGIG